MATVSLECRDRHASTNRRIKVRIRIHHRGTDRYVTTPIEVDPAKWRGDRVTKSHHESARINDALRQVLSKAQSALTRVQTSGLEVTADRVKTAVEEALRPETRMDSETPTFLEYARGRLKTYDKPGTIRNHRSGLNKFERFLKEERGRSDVPFDPAALTAQLLEDYMAWERKTLENSVNTVHKTMRTIRRMVNLAIRDGHLSRDDYPFDGLTLRRRRTAKRALTSEGVHKLEALLEKVEAGDAEYPEPGTLAHHMLRTFLFQMYTLGMRWSDVCPLRWSQIQDGRLSYSMVKTGKPKDLKIVPKARRILGCYESRRGKKRYVFPYLDRYELDPGYDLDDEDDLKRAIDSRNTKVNEKLKIIGRKLKLSVKLTTHVARHSFAVAAMEAGWTLQEIQTALGHRDISETQAYLKSLRDDELDDKHEELF